MLSTLLLTSCLSNKVVTVYPELYFPQFPAPDMVVPYDENMEKVTAPQTEIKYVCITFEYYKRLAEFKMDLKETEAKYNGFIESLEK